MKGSDWLNENKDNYGDIQQIRQLRETIFENYQKNSHSSLG